MTDAPFIHDVLLAGIKEKSTKLLFRKCTSRFLMQLFVYNTCCTYSAPLHANFEKLENIATKNYITENKVKMESTHCLQCVLNIWCGKIV